MMDDLAGELRRSPSGDGWQGHIIVGGRTIVLVGTLAQDAEGKYLSLQAKLCGVDYTPADLDRLERARANKAPMPGMPQAPGRVRLPKDPVPTFEGPQGT